MRTRKEGAGRLDILNLAKSLCEKNGARLLYLCLFGSKLYGTEVSGASDTDVRGVFLPSVESLVLGKDVPSIHFSTGDEGKNGPGDVDLDMFSLQSWVFEQLALAQMPGMDLLFSPSNPSCVLWFDPLLAPFFEKPLLYFDAGRTQGCFDYASREVRKYGVLGTRMGAVGAAASLAASLVASGQGKDALSMHAAAMVDACADQRFCAIEDRKGEKFLRFCGRLYPLSSKVGDFCGKAEAERARLAGHGKEVDWKCVSHALRAVRQWEELLEEGKVSFPLRSREELLLVKRGRLSWEESEALLLAGYERVAKLAGSARSLFDADEARARVLACYGL